MNNIDREPVPTPLECAEYEFATIEYDYKVHPVAAQRISALFSWLYNEVLKREPVPDPEDGIEGSIRIYTKRQSGRWERLTTVEQAIEFTKARTSPFK